MDGGWIVAKTGIPTFVSLAHGLDVYLSRNQTNIQEALDAEDVAAFLAFIDCLKAVLLAIGKLPVNP